MFYHAKKTLRNTRASGPDPALAVLLLKRSGGANVSQLV